MYEYGFVKLDISMGANDEAKHREIIRKNAEKGWRFVAVVPRVDDKFYHEIDLVFEREVK